VLLGVVSLFADMTYEGARSITGPFLAVLGASATVVGIVAGFGELVGYGLRLVSGYVADRTQRYWAITIAGYAVNLLAVPILALAGRWEVAALFIILERAGKAMRTPPRDAMLSHATHQVGRGWGFGLHEALDQVGAVLGPLLVAGVLALQGDYRPAFAVLGLSALAALALPPATRVAARLGYPTPRDFEARTELAVDGAFPKSFWLYIVAAALIAAGYADFPLVAFHFQRTGLAAPEWIAILYALAMGVDAAAALAFGRLFDRFGVRTLIPAAIVSSLFAPLVFLGSFPLALIGMACWGIGMGAQESVMRAAVAGFVPPERRGSAYGVFNAGYGLFWFLGSALLGILYDQSIPWLVAFSVTVQLLAVPVLLVVQRKATKRAQ
jgi:MFS family permease